MLVVDSYTINKMKATDQQMTELIMKHNILQQQIDRWRNVQNVYMLSITKYQAECISFNGISQAFANPETIFLCLFSTPPPPNIIFTVPFNVMDIKTHLQFSQMNDSLNDLKRFL